MKLLEPSSSGYFSPLPPSNASPSTKPSKSDHGGVAVLGGAALHGDHAAALLLHAGELGVDLGVGRLDDLLLHLDALVALDGDLRLDGDGRLEGVAVLRDVEHLDIGAVDRLDALFLDGGVVGRGVGVVDGLLIEDALAVQLFDHPAGGLAAAEAGNGHPLDILFEHLVDRLAERLGVDGDGELYLFVLVGLHFCYCHSTSS